MALHDFHCAGCDLDILDVNVPIALGARAAEVRCPQCDQPAEWVPQVGRMDNYDVNGSFTTTVRQPDGSYKPVTVSGLSGIRKLERETEQAYRNGEGQPMRWRAYSQDRGNQYENSFGPDPSQKPTRTTVRGEKLTVRRRGGDAPVSIV